MTQQGPSEGLPARQAIALLLGVTFLCAVVLAGSIWVMLPEQQESPPNTKFVWEYNGDDLTATHQGGDTIPASRLSVRGTGITNSGNPLTESNQYTTDATFTFGDQVVIGTGHYAWTNDSAPSTIRLVWTSRDGDQAATIAQWGGTSS